MTVKEMKEIMANMNDNDEIVVVEIKTYNDPWSGWGENFETEVKRYNITTKKAFEEKEEAERKAREEKDRKDAIARNERYEKDIEEIEASKVRCRTENGIAKKDKEIARIKKWIEENKARYNI